MVGFVFCFWKIMMLACGLERTIRWWTVGPEGPRATNFVGTIHLIVGSTDSTQLCGSKDSETQWFREQLFHC